MRQESISLAFIVVAILISQIAAVCRNRPDGVCENIVTLSDFNGNKNFGSVFRG